MCMSDFLTPTEVLRRVKTMDQKKEDQKKEENQGKGLKPDLLSDQASSPSSCTDDYCAWSDDFYDPEERCLDDQS